MSDSSPSNGTSAIPEATIICQIAMTDDYTIAEAQQALVQIAVCLNRMAGIALTKRALSVANPIMQAVLSASGNCETAAVQIEQTQQQMKQNSAIIQPGMRPAPLPFKH